jgi:hypothetical protein
MRPCKNCSEDFEVTEHDEAYCSWECAQRYADRQESWVAYEEARYSAAPVN